MKYLLIFLLFLSCSKESDQKYFWDCVHDQGGDCEGYGKMTRAEADKYMQEHPHCHCEPRE